MRRPGRRSPAHAALRCQVPVPVAHGWPLATPPAEPSAPASPLRSDLPSGAMPSRNCLQSPARLPKGQAKRPKRSSCLQGGSRSRRVLPAPGASAAESRRASGTVGCGVSVSPPSPAWQRQPEGAELPACVLGKGKKNLKTSLCMMVLHKPGKDVV